MKKLFLFTSVILLINFANLGHAQKDPEEQRAIRTISVSGIAEKEIAPDILFFTVSLKEFQLKSGSKYSISELEQQLIQALQDAGVDKNNLKVENVYGYNYSWNQKNKNEDFMARKQFQLKLSNAKKLNSILSKIDPKGIEYARISQYTHSQINQLNLDLQIEAVKNARIKAEALLDALNEKVGKVLEVSENQQNFQPIYYKSYQNNRMLAANAEESGGVDSDLDFKNIKLKAEVHIVFLIQ